MTCRSSAPHRRGGPRQGVTANKTKRGTPAPARAHGPLLPSGPGGVNEMDAAGVLPRILRQLHGDSARAHQRA